MGKSKKIKHFKVSRNPPLAQQIGEQNVVKGKERQQTRSDGNIDEDIQRNYIDSKLTSRILSSARRQQSELEEEYGLGTSGGQRLHQKQTKLSEREDMNDSDGDSDSGDGMASDDDHNTAPDDYYEHIVVTEEEEKALELFMNRDVVKRKTLADIIAEKIREKETEIHTQLSDNMSVKVQEMDGKVIELYKGVKLVLSRYRSGKLPKAFKIIPALNNWEQVLQLTDPDGWTAAAMMAATRIFTSNLKERMAQRFYNLILLPRLRDDIQEYKQLNFHLYQALRKALFKSGAFFKGIILPLCESSDCTLREAVIIGSVMARQHIPVLHSCAAMLKIAEMDYSGANSVFLHVLISKKYALPYRVVDALVYHFLHFLTDKRELPVLWHQCLLVFAQIYKQDLSSEQRESLLELLRAQTHYKITPEIRKELLNCKPRDEESAPPSEARSETMDVIKE